MNIPYGITELWLEGAGKAIVIEPQHRNQADLRQFAHQLKRDNAQMDTAFVKVFDDRWSAINRHMMEEHIGPERLEFRMNHEIGFYVKNAETGAHHFTFWLDGINGNQSEDVDLT